VQPSAAEVLEVACGTGLLTRELLRVLAASAHLTSTDLNEPMLAAAQQRVADPRVRWQRADIMALPFDEAAFDVVVCQFGVMFFPDKVHAAAQVRRVLRPGGTYLFNVWAGLEDNPVARVAQQTIDECFPADPPRFYHVPHGYHDPRRIKADLSAAGFGHVAVDVRDLMCASESAEHAATGMVQGTPMFFAVRERSAPTVEEVTRRMADALRTEFGTGRIQTTMRELVVSAS
jgi:SAM-dependent methyltransferase